MMTDSQRASNAEIVAIVNLYGHIADSKVWKDMHQVFTEDVIIDSSDMRMPPIVGLGGLISVFEVTQHPVAHHMTNVVVEWGDADDVATVRTKWMGIREDGTVATGDYLDLAVRTPDGWRIAKRTATLRRNISSPRPAVRPH